MPTPIEELQLNEQTYLPLGAYHGNPQDFVQVEHIFRAVNICGSKAKEAVEAASSAAVIKTNLENALLEIEAFINDANGSLSLIEQMKTSKQDKLVSGANIKTINGFSILGDGNLNFLADANLISLLGDTKIYIAETKVFTITNYDDFSSYDVKVSAGSVSMLRDKITFVAPAMAQYVNLDIYRNEGVRRIVLDIISNAINTPSILFPVNNTIDMINTITLTSSSFISSVSGDLHHSTTWQVSKTPDFSADIIFLSNDDQVNKLQFKINNLELDTTYYARIRYKGTITGYSEWSPVITFKTKKKFFAELEVASLKKIGSYPFDSFGYNIAISGDGLHVAIAQINISVVADDPKTNEGDVYIYSNINSSWVLTATINPLAERANDKFGHGLCFNYDGTMLVVGSTHAEPDAIVKSTGKFYIFKKQGNNWLQSNEFFPEEISYYQYFGFPLALSKDQNFIAVSNDKNGEFNNKIVIYSTVNNVWGRSAVLKPSDASSFDSFANKVVVLSKHGDYCVSSKHLPYNSDYTFYLKGRVYIFNRIGASWTEQQIITASDGTNWDQFGKNLAINEDGTVLAVAAETHPASAMQVPEYRVYIFERTGSNWAEKQIINDISYGLNFGKYLKFSQQGDCLFIGSDTKGIYFVKKETAWEIEKELDLSSYPHISNFTISDNCNVLMISDITADTDGIIDSGIVHVLA